MRLQDLCTGAMLLNCLCRLQRMQACENRIGSNLLIDLRIVFHRTASERVESGIHAEIHLRKICIMADYIKFAYLREGWSICAKKTCRKFGNG